MVQTMEYETAKALFQKLRRDKAAVVSSQNTKLLFREIEDATKNATIHDVNSEFVHRFVVAVYLLNQEFRNRVKDARRIRFKRDLRKKTGPKVKEEEEEIDPELTITNNNSNEDEDDCSKKSQEKITRENSIPAYVNKSSSCLIKSAVVLFVTSGCMKESLRLRAMLHLLSYPDSSVSKVLRSDKNALRSLKLPNDVDTKTDQLIVQTFMELAEILSDKVYAKLAALMNEKIYLAATRHFSQIGCFGTTYPYDHLIVRYLRECVAPKHVEQEQQTVLKQFAVNPKSIVTYMANELSGHVEASFLKSDESATNAQSAGRKRKASDATSFVDPEQTYEVFKGPLNYQTSLLVTNVTQQNRIYRVVTYNDCLYDVVSCFIEQEGDGNTGGESIGYGKLPWSQRLDLMPYRAKIELLKMSGSEILAFEGSASLAVSWMENGYEYSKTLNFNSKLKKIS